MDVTIPVTVQLPLSIPLIMQLIQIAMYICVYVHSIRCAFKHMHRTYTHTHTHTHTQSYTLREQDEMRSGHQHWKQNITSPQAISQAPSHSWYHKILPQCLDNVLPYCRTHSWSVKFIVLTEFHVLKQSSRYNELCIHRISVTVFGLHNTPSKTKYSILQTAGVRSTTKAH